MQTIVAAALRGKSDEARARQLYERDREAVTLSRLAMARHLPALEAPDTFMPSRTRPPGPIPIYAKHPAGERPVPSSDQ